MHISLGNNAIRLIVPFIEILSVFFEPGRSQQNAKWNFSSPLTEIGTTGYV
jgi:hypothetical protein